MTYGVDPEELDRLHRATQSPRAIAGRAIMVVLLLLFFGGIVLIMAS